MTNYSEKHYASDTAKARSRDLLRTMTQEHLFKNRKPTTVKVLCFPGIDAQEVTDVYDPLGIPRQNIIGLERERNIAEIIRKNCPGITVVNQTLEDYIAEQKSIAFDIISLDYIGALDEYQMDVMESIRVKNNRDEFMFHANNLARRDQNSLQFYSAGHGLQAALGGSVNDDPYTTSYMKEATARFREVFHTKGASFVERKQTDQVNQEEKIASYGTTIRFGFMGRTPEMMDRAFRFCMGSKYDEFKQAMITEASSVLEQHNITHRDPWRTTMNTTIPGDLLEDKALLWCKNNGFPSELKDIIVHAVLNASIGPYFLPVNSKGYSYISESGSPMVGCIFHAVFPRSFAHANKRIAQETGYPHGFRPANKVAFIKEIQRLQREYLTNPLAQFTGHLLGEESVFLGNSSRPVLTKKRFIAELEAGKDIAYVQEQYRGWQKKPLAQWKAHHTMGTYHEESFPLESTEDDSIEKVTKEQVIDLLVAGVPTDEVYNTYPTSFTRGQLAAFKAHLTMGRYKETS